MSVITPQEQGFTAKELELLDTRRERLAQSGGQDQARSLVYHVVVVRVGESRLGLSLNGLRELVELQSTTPLPHLPPWFVGVSHLRGEMLSVVNLGALLGIASEGECGLMAVVRGNDGAIGVAVESVFGFREVFHDELDDTFVCSRPESAGLVCAVTREPLCIIDPSFLLEDKRILVGGANRHTGQIRQPL